MKHVEQHSPMSLRSNAHQRGRSRRPLSVRVGCAGVLAAVALVVAGCASSSSAARASATGSGVGVTAVPAAALTSTPRAENTRPAQNLSAVQTAGAKSEGSVEVTIRHALRRPNERPKPLMVSRGSNVQRPFAGTGGNVANDDNPTGHASRSDTGNRPTTNGQPNPCTLVSRSQAQAVTGRAITVTEAPLGPTCIYHERGTSASITLAVERAQFSSVKKYLKHVSTYTIRGRTAYCGVYGSTALYVPLGTNRLLNVTAPCSVAVKFASIALVKLG
jgi:hypothetical protein